VLLLCPHAQNQSYNIIDTQFEPIFRRKISPLLPLQACPVHQDQRPLAAPVVATGTASQRADSRFEVVVVSQIKYSRSWSHVASTYLVKVAISLIRRLPVVILGVSWRGVQKPLWPTCSDVSPVGLLSSWVLHPGMHLNEQAEYPCLPQF